MPRVDPWIHPQATRNAWRRDGPKAVFDPVRPLRPLIVVVSEEVLAEEGDERTGLLLGLLQDETVTLLRYADAGPPDEVERRVVENIGVVADGWIIVEAPADHDGGAAVYSDGTSATRTAMGSSEIVRFAAADGWDTYAGTGPGDPRVRAGRDALCVAAADAVGADLLITRRSLALDPPFKLTRGPLAVLTPEDAMPVVGLYLRRQGEFIVWRSVDGQGTYQFNRGLFYLVAARDQLPSAWRWMSRCASARGGDQSLSWLTTSLIDRVARSLQARDHLHSALLQPQDNDVADDALMYLDLILVSLMGAFDAAARVLHRVLGLPEEDEFQAAWQRSAWRRRWAPDAPRLAEFMGSGGEAEAALTVLRLLRNSVHGEALSPLAIVARMKRREDTLVGLPRQEREQLEAALDSLGGLDGWGVRALVPDRLHADARVLVERLLPATLKVLDQILHLTPVERLSIPDDVLIPDGPPPDATEYGEKAREAIRRQLGFEDPTEAP